MTQPVAPEAVFQVDAHMEPCIRYLGQSGLQWLKDYAVIGHKAANDTRAHASALTAALQANSSYVLAKSLPLKSGNDYFLFVLKADNCLQTNQLTAAARIPHTHFTGTKAALEDIFGVESAALTPLAVPNDRTRCVQVIMDQALTEGSIGVFAWCTNATIFLTYGALERYLTHHGHTPRLISFPTATHQVTSTELQGYGIMNSNSQSTISGLVANAANDRRRMTERDIQLAVSAARLFTCIAIALYFLLPYYGYSVEVTHATSAALQLTSIAMTAYRWYLVYQLSHFKPWGDQLDLAHCVISVTTTLAATLGWISAGHAIAAWSCSVVCATLSELAFGLLDRYRMLNNALNQTTHQNRNQDVVAWLLFLHLFLSAILSFTAKISGAASIVFHCWPLLVVYASAMIGHHYHKDYMLKDKLLYAILVTWPKEQQTGGLD